MMKTRLAIVTLAIAGLASPAFATGTTSYKHSRHHTSMTTDKSMSSNKKPGTTTGANMKSKSSTKSGSDNNNTGSGGSTDTGK